jgi:hypothetical protein
MAQIRTVASIYLHYIRPLKLVNLIIQLLDFSFRGKEQMPMHLGSRVLF